MNLLFNIIVGIFAVIGLVTVSIVTYEIYKEKRKQKDIRIQLELLVIALAILIGMLIGVLF